MYTLRLSLVCSCVFKELLSSEEDKDIVMVFLISLSHKITFNKIFRSDILCPSKKLVVVFVMSRLGLKLLCICMFRIYKGLSIYYVIHDGGAGVFPIYYNIT